MWSEESGMTNVLFDTWINKERYKFTQEMWFEEPGMTKHYNKM